MSSMYGLQTSSDMNHLHGVCDPHMNGLSLQEMIDTDIKADFDDVMTSNQLGFSNVDSLDLLNNLDSIDTPFKFDARYHDVDEVLNHPAQWSSHQLAGQDVSALNSNYFDDSLSNNVMVNPNSVMPVHQQQQQQQQQYAPVASPSPHQPLLTVNTQINTYSPHPRAHHSPAPAMSPHPQHQHYPQPQQQQQQQQRGVATFDPGSFFFDLAATPTIPGGNPYSSLVLRGAAEQLQVTLDQRY